MDKSPHYIAGTVQVAKGARLTIADGAIVERLKPVPCTTDCVGTTPATGVINVASALVVGGKYQTQLLGLMVSNLTVQTGGGTVSIQYGLLEDTFLQISNVQPFTMMHTTAYRLNVIPKVQNSVTTYQPLNNFEPSFTSAYIKYNTLIDSAVFYFDPSDTIQYNLFLSLVSPLVLTNTSMPTDPNALTQQNSFLFKHGSSNTNRMVVETYGRYDSRLVYMLDFTNNTTRERPTRRSSDRAWQTVRTRAIRSCPMSSIIRSPLSSRIRQRLPIRNTAFRMNKR